MANIEKLQFSALKITGENYIEWITNEKPYLVMKKITETIRIGNKSPPEHIAEAIIFLKKHLDENLTHDYASVEDSAELWQALKERFDNQREVNLPHALEEWKNLRFQDFQKVEDYNSAVLGILHFLPEIYGKCGYTRVSELIVALMLAEKNNELLIKNHNSRPTGAKAFPEVNATAIENSERKNQTNRGHGRRFNNKRGKTYNPKWKGSNKWVRSGQVSKGKETQENTTQKRETVCYRCGCKGHRSRTCHTPPHLCKLYQESTKGKSKELNLTENFKGTSYLDASDFANELD
uniref:CCHC-type domain-containing protein n=1 Tax=Brassica oleracea var. oleracea TaxID=109376 RepID=A0A0D3CP43_BRAOL